MQCFAYKIGIWLWFHNFSVQALRGEIQERILSLCSIVYVQLPLQLSCSLEKTQLMTRAVSILQWSYSFIKWQLSFSILTRESKNKLIFVNFNVSPCFIVIINHSVEREKYSVTTGSSNLKLKVKWISQTELIQREKAHVSPYNTEINLHLLDT